MKAKLISLYECLNARYPANGTERIYCSQGYFLGKHKNGTVSVQRVMRGEPLIYDACQSCKDFIRNGEPVNPEERGWLK